MDIVASLYGRNNILDVVQQTARNTFVPLTVGGGIRAVDDIVAALRSGADKVAINTAAIRNPDFIREAANAVGSQAIVLSIEALRVADKRWEAQHDNGREHTGRDVIEWAEQAAHFGAGEILVTSIDQEGTRKGFDLALLEAIRRRVRIPVIASGGAGSTNHIADIFSRQAADAVAVATLLHYGEQTASTIKIQLEQAGLKVRQDGGEE